MLQTTPRKIPRTSRKNLIRVLICDDSAFLRVTLRRIIESDPQMRVVDFARNGAEAVDKAVRLRPDVITMDIHMPLVDGVTALKDIVYLKLAPVIMLAATTSEDAAAAIEAMEAGAFDFIAKPSNVDHLDHHASAIIQKIKQASMANIYGKSTVPEPADYTIGERQIPIAPLTPLPRFGYKAVALGLSTGGPKAIFEVLPLLPANLNAAVFVVQHMPAAFLTTFTERLGQRTKLPCVQSDAGMVIESGHIYVARGGYHLKLLRKNSGEVVIRQTKEPQHLFMPSVDITMSSVCDVFGVDTIGVLMTGMGWDGAEGMLKIATAGGMTIAESEETAVVFGMPKEAIKRGAAKQILPNPKIAAEITKAAGTRS